MPILKPTRGIQLTKSHPLVRDLIGYWLFDEGSGVKAFDLSGNGKIGTFGAGAASPTWTAGKFGYALSFDGGDYVGIGNYSIFEGMAQLTIIGWARGTAWGVDIIASKAYGAPSYALQMDAAGKASIRVWTSSGLVTTAGVRVINDGLWHQWVLVYDGVNQYVYVDGVLENSDVQTGLVDTGGDGFAIGALWDGSTGHTANWRDGAIDHVLIWNRALSAFEVGLLYRKPFCMFEDWNIARISSVVANGFVEIVGSLAAVSFLTDVAALKRSRVIAGGVAAQSSLAGAIKVSKKISGVIAATSSLSGELSLVGEVSRSRGSGFKPIEGAERLRGLRRSAFY